MLAVLLVAALAVTADAARGPPALGLTPIVDAPYRELISHRYTYKSQKPVYAWGTLPFDTVYDTCGGITLGGNRGWLLGTDIGLVWLAQETKPIVQPITVAGGNPPINWKEAKLACMPGTPPALFVADSTTVSEVIFDSPTKATAAIQFTHSFGTVNDTCFDGSGLWMATQKGTARALVMSETISLLDTRTSYAVACSTTSQIAYSGGGETVNRYTQGVLERWDWVTDLVTEAGGVYDGEVRSLALDKHGNLFVGTPTAINMRNATTGVVTRYDYLQGVPMNDTRTVSVSPYTQALWFTGPTAAARFSRGQDVDDWRYFHGPRFLADSGPVLTVDASHPNMTLVVSEGTGLAVLEWQWWTLREKAMHYETVLDRHTRHGMVADCNLKAFGNYSSCTNGPSDNNGLWTSLVVIAEAYRYFLEPSDDQLNRALLYLNAMKMLSDITGVKGLIARSCVSPEEPIPQGGVWHNSTNPDYKGWLWKGDASSDEVVGHFFAYNAIPWAAPNTTLNNIAIEYMENIASYIIDNGFYLIDVTGNHTTWGVWAPEVLNKNRDWSDERGLNSMQILAYCAALSYYGNSTETRAKGLNAFKQLTNVTNQYDENMLNLKIESPDDDNYSDDELAFLPLYVFGTVANSDPTVDLALYREGLRRSWGFVRHLKSAAWTSMYAAINGDVTQQDLEDMAWNLRTWPLELVDFPVKNSDRRDIFLDKEADRSNRLGNDVLRILPAYERPQLRWNSDPYDADGGSGMSEGDPGAFLWPYWLARFHNLLTSDKP